MTQREAVFQALVAIGPRTSLAVLAKRASLLYGSGIYEQAACKFRVEWCKKNKIVVDCRTYQGQPRRDMLKDDEVSLPQVRRLNLYFRNTRTSTKQLRELIGSGPTRFHSIEQLAYAVTELEQLQAAA